MPAEKPASFPAALLWDFDGTIVDSLPSWERAELRVLGELGVTETDALMRHIEGYTIERVAESIVEALALPAERTDEIADRINAAWLEDMRARDLQPLPGVRALFAEASAAGVPCAVASQTLVRLMRDVLGNLGLDVPVLIGGDSVTHAKPDPEPYRRAASELGVDPRDCVALDDSITGVTAGVAAGCVTVAVTSRAAGVEGIALTVPSLADVSLRALSGLAAEARDA